MLPRSLPTQNDASVRSISIADGWNSSGLTSTSNIPVRSQWRPRRWGDATRAHRFAHRHRVRLHPLNATNFRRPPQTALAPISAEPRDRSRTSFLVVGLILRSECLGAFQKCFVEHRFSSGVPSVRSSSFISIREMEGKLVFAQRRRSAEMYKARLSAPPRLCASY